MHEENRISISNILTTLAALMVLSYFAYHAVSGERGLLALTELSKRVEYSQNKLDSLNAERISFEHKVSLLRDESLDLDMLDEQARRMLGYVGDGETVYLKQ